MDSAKEYLTTCNLTEKIRFTPNPILTGTQYETMIIKFLNESYSADDLCTWNLKYERVNGLVSVEDAKDVCVYVDCLFVPSALFVAGYVMLGINFFLAAS